MGDKIDQLLRAQMGEYIRCRHVRPHPLAETQVRSRIRSRCFVRLSEAWTGVRGWDQYSVVRSDVESLFLEGDQSLVE